MNKQKDDQIFKSIVELKYFALGGTVLLFVLLGLVVYLDRNHETFEKSAQYQPPPDTANGTEGTGVTTTESVPVHPVRGQTVYVPAYSHIYHQDGKAILLTVTLSIRNTSLDHDLFVESVRYFDTGGNEVRSYLKKPLRLAPLATTEFLVEQDDKAGGSGANFIVQWVSDQPVTNPVIEAVMIDTNRQQGISFARSGVAVREVETRPEPTP